MGIVALHVAGGILDQGLARKLARRLRAARQRIDLGDDGHLGTARAPFGPDIRWHAGTAELDPEARRLERILEQLGALEFLHPELAEIIERIADVGHRLDVALDHVECQLLAVVGRRGRERNGEREPNNRKRRY